MKKFTIFIVLLGFTFLSFFSPIWRERQIPFPGHLLASFFSPWKDMVWPGYPAGVPHKDLLGFDTVRMMGPWRHFITEELRQGRLPIWNPHQFMGAPMLGNGQSAIWFPLNWAYLILPFNISWSLLVVLQPILAAMSMYIFLRIKKYSFWAITFISLVYGFSSWLSVWIEWNIHGFVYALLPLALAAIEKKKFWSTVSVLSLIVFAGHPQMALIACAGLFLYTLTTSRTRWFLTSIVVVGVVTFIQWWPELVYYKEASREHQSDEFRYEKTLFPWKQIPQLLAPNFFGNPATGNFHGTANFVETTAYIGIGTVGFALLGLFRRKERKFPLLLVLLIFLFATPTPVSFIVGKIGIPILSTSVASRWLILWPLALSILAANGIDYFIDEKRLKFLKVGWVMSLLTGLLWAGTFTETVLLRSTSQRNLLLPSAISVLFISAMFVRRFPVRLSICLIGLVTMVELVLFGHKIMTYTEPGFMYPNTPVLEELQQLSKDGSRFASSEGSVVETNFATQYGFFDIAGYDALYPRRVGELVWTAHHEGIPFSGFPRSTVVTPTVPSKARDVLWNLAGAKWILHKDDQFMEHPNHHNAALFDPNQFDLVWQDGKWQIYQNKLAFPRAFFMKDASWVGEGLDMVRKVYSDMLPEVIPATIVRYEPNRVDIAIDVPSDGYVVLTDTFYPGWKATVDGHSTQIVPAFHAFRAVKVSHGSHKAEFVL